MKMLQEGVHSTHCAATRLFEFSLGYLSNKCSNISFEHILGSFFLTYISSII